jgi:hypothetical protein
MLMSGPAAVAVEMFMLGALPPDGLERVITKKGIGDAD